MSENPDYARQLLAHRTRAGLIQLAAIPTTNGFVCLAYVGDDRMSSGTCIQQLSKARPISVQGLGSGGQSTLIGIAKDGVRAVIVVTAFGRQAAGMGRNAYIWPGPDNARPSSIEVTMEDGSVISVDAPEICPT